MESHWVEQAKPACRCQKTLALAWTQARRTPTLNFS
jgi:hypothetical protein